MNDSKRSPLGAPSIPTIHTSEDLRRKMESIVRWYYRRFPLTCRSFIEHVKQVRQNMNPLGMSFGGTMLVKATMPRTLHQMLHNPPWTQEKLGLPINWLDDPKYATPFYQAFACFCPNDTSIPECRHQDRVREYYEDDELEQMEESKRDFTEA